MKLPHVFTGLFLAAPLFAATPSVTILTPAGGQRGTTVTVTAAGTLDAWPMKVWSSSPGVTATPDKEKGKFAVTIAADAPLGVAWLRFHDGGASELRPFVVGDLPEQAEVEPNDDARTSPVVAGPKVVNGVLAKSGDVDCFAVKLTIGQTIVASLDAHRTLRSPIDAVLQVTSADGTVLEQNHDARGLDPEVAFTAPAAGTFVVRVFAFPSAPDSSIRHFGSPACVYRLTLTTEEFVDFVSPLAVEQGKEAKIAIAGWNLKSASASLGKSDAVFGVAHPFAIAREPHPCHDLTTAAVRPLSPPFTATGRVRERNAPAVIPITAEAGKPLILRLDSTTLGLSLTPVLRVFDSADKQLLKAEPAALGGGIDATFTPPKSGEYKVEVRDLFNSAGPRHLFRLRVMPAAPDVAVAVVADRFTFAVGTPLDIPLTLVKKNGFKDELVPFADGLPDGVTASVGIPAKPDPNTVVLRLTAAGLGSSGPIRIGVGKKGDSTFKRFATAAQSAFERTTSDLWLTVSPTPAK